MAISGVSTTAVNWVGTMLIAHGADFVRKLGTQNIRIYNLTGRALANLMTAGEVVLSPTIYNSHVAASAEKGAPLGWYCARPGAGDRLRRRDRPQGAASARRHAVHRFPDVEGGPGALSGARLRLAAQRRGKASAGAKLERLYLTNRPNYIREYEDWAKLYQDVFVRRRI